MTISEKGSGGFRTGRIQMNRLLKLMSTVTLGGSLPEKLRAIGSAGFDGVELVAEDLDIFQGTVRDVRNITRDLGIDIIVFAPLRDFEGCPRRELPHRLDSAERMLDVMGELNAKTLLVCSNTSEDMLPDEEIMAGDLLALAERAGRRGMRVGYEALSWGRYIYSYRAAWNLVKMVANPYLGVVLDTFHTFCLDEDLSELMYIPPVHIFLIQVADAPRLSIEPVKWSRRFRCFPGFGDFDLAAFLTPLLASGYQGHLSLEIFNDLYSAMPPVPVAVQGFRALYDLEKTVKSKMQRSRQAHMLEGVAT
jgi:4-hydroxyphenylpyruvate dioxygenase